MKKCASTSLIEMQLDRWDKTLAPEDQAEAITAVESGGVLLFPRLAFALEPEERRFLSADWSDGKTKNISFDLPTGKLAGARGATADIAALSRLTERFAHCARGLIDRLFPAYKRALVGSRTTFRPLGAAERQISWRKDDRLLHIDAFRRGRLAASASCGYSTT